MSQGVKLYIGNLADYTKVADVEWFLRDAIKVDLMLDDDGRCKGFGFAEFAKKKAAEKALKKDGQMLHGQFVLLKMREEKSVSVPFKAGHVIAVTGFSINGSLDRMRRELKKRFEGCGQIKELFLPESLNTNLKRHETGTAYVEFADLDGLKKALDTSYAVPLEGDCKLLRIVVPMFKHIPFLRQTGGERGGNCGYKYGHHFEVNSTLMPSGGGSVGRGGRGGGGGMAGSGGGGGSGSGGDITMAVSEDDVDDDDHMDEDGDDNDTQEDDSDYDGSDDNYDDDIDDD